MHLKHASHAVMRKTRVSQSSSPWNGVIQQFDNEYREWRRNQLMQLGARYPGLASGYWQFHILSYRCIGAIYNLLKTSLKIFKLNCYVE